MSAPPAFRLQTLGTLRLFAPDGGEAPLLVNRRQKLAILALLAVTRRPISRDRLVELFWGDRTESRARHSLSEALSQLRRVLGPRAIRARQSEVALAEHAPVTVDLRELAEAASTKDWRRTIALYEGPFFDGIHVDGSPEWEHWVLAQRQGAERLFEHACRAEAERLNATENWPELETVANRWLQRSPLDPLAARQLLTAVGRSAPASAATLARVHAVYDGLAQRLSADHGIAPAQEVTSLRDRLVAELERDDPSAHETPAPIDAITPAVPRLDARSEGHERRRHRSARTLRTLVKPPLLVAAALLCLLVVALGRDASRRPTLEPERGPVSPSEVEARRLVAIASRGGMPQLSRAEIIALLRQAVALDSSLAMAHRNLALLLESDGTQSALVSASLTRAAALSSRVTLPERESILSSYHLLVTGDYAEAAEHQRALLRLNPDDGDAWHELGMTYQYLGDHARAAEAYRQTLMRDPTSAPTWANLVDALYAAGADGDAKAAIDSMAAAIPGHPSVFSATSRFYAAQGNLRGAEAQARAYLAATSTRPRSQGIGEMLLSRILWSQGRLHEGDAAILRGIEKHLQAADTVMALREALVLATSAYWNRGEPATAKRLLDVALRRFPMARLPAGDRPYLELATAQALAGDTASARRSLDEYERLAPPTIRRRNAGAEALARGTLALRSGQVRTAVTMLQEASTVDCPACGLPELGVAYSMLGYPDSVRLAHERYLSYPSLRRTDLHDALHRRRLESRIRSATD